ncbi:MAG: hypothetical protein ATN31_05665 [Candidatus Epulonipiscioides saccharophilum]|nr:MAG: hypothetical protein ATN31_05665 [Epulopiscium sp. AS2M-Bin001]
MPPVAYLHCNNDGMDLEDTQIKHISLELTERCNLRCKYCIYHEDQCGFRNFGMTDMSFEVAKKAIDILKLSNESTVYLSFYGGEPLLKFNLLQECIQYCTETLHNKTIIYNMTTNATLISEDIAKYLMNIENFSITISLDGPKMIHDKNRIFSIGEGSFDKCYQGVQNLINAAQDDVAKRINFNIVLSDTKVSTLLLKKKRLSQMRKIISDSLCFKQKSLSYC